MLRLDKRDGLAILALCAIVAACFWRMVLTDLILPRGDAFTYFYPYWQYRHQALLAGRLPLWNPTLFMGVPFLANSQAAVLYPFNWLLAPLDAPTAVKVAIVSHVMIAATGMYLFARRPLHTGILGATTAGLVFALGGYFTAQAEHVNQLQGLAWLPWLFWLWEEALHKKRLMLVLAVVLAMQLLAGHTQSAFISGVGLGLWAVWHSIEVWRSSAEDALVSRRRDWTLSHQPELRRALLIPLGLLAGAAILSMGLSAAQILPTLELTSLSHRSGGLPFLDAVSFSLRPQLIGRALLPGYTSPRLFSEYTAYPGIAALLLACLGGWVMRRRWKVAGLIMLAGAGVFLALGAYNPVYWLLVRAVPGFDLFRAPARWLVLWALAISALAGTGIDTLVIGFQLDSALSERLKAAAKPLAGGILLVIGLAALSPLAALNADEVMGATAPTLTEVGVWAITMALAMGLVIWALVARRMPLLPSALTVLVTLELFFAGRALPYNQLSAPAAWSSQRPAISTLLAEQKDEVVPARFLSLSDIRFDPGDLREIEAIFGPRLSEDALYDYIIATKQKEILAPNLPMAWGIHAMDGFDGGILPTRDYIRFTGLFLDEGEVTPDGRLRENLHAVPEQHWLDLGNVRYVITDKVYDVWADGIYYDLQFDTRRSAGQESSVPITIVPSQQFEATTIGLVGHIEGESGVQDGSTIGTIVIYPTGVTDPSGLIVLPLVSGDHFIQGQQDSTASPNVEPLGYFTRTDPQLAEYRALISWGLPMAVERIEVTIDPDFSGTLILRGATLIDERSGAFLPLSLSPDRRLIHSGDVKIYEMESISPRAYLVCNPVFAADEEAGWAHLAESAAAGTPVVNEPSPPNDESCDERQPGGASVTSYTPERITIDVDAAGPGVYLIVADAWYPGWSAEVDGEPVSIRRANGLFRAVPVPPGARQVVFTYRSRPFEIGAVISAASVVAVVLGLITIRPRRNSKM